MVFSSTISYSSYTKMVSLFGVPLFGTLFVPLIVGLGSLFLFWKFFLSSKSFSSPVPSNNELQKPNAYIESQLTDSGTVHSNSTKEKPKERKKGCGGKGKGGCCSSKNGQSGTCSSTNKAISRAKIFADVNSEVCQAYVSSLSSQLTEVCGSSEIIHPPKTKIDLPQHVDGSLCIFLLDSSIYHDQHWLLTATKDLTDLNRSLSGMKYSVFLFHDASSVEFKVETVDQLLHKLGAVRVCKADSSHPRSTLACSEFEGWAEELIAQVQRWNAPKSKACKCGPKKKDQNNESCGSSTCSDSDTQEELNDTTPAPLLDLEDLARFL